MIRVKKYFYVLRPLLAMRWIECGYGVAPTDFNVALEKLALVPDLKQAVSKLLESKRAGDELDSGERIPVISEFIECELERWEHSDIPKGIHPPDGSKLDEFFRESLEEVWQD